MAGQESLRAATARDKDFVGVDIAAMAQLIHQMDSASGAISEWLRTNGALPPSVPRTGLREASAVNTWVTAQSGMLTRRRNYAITHLSKGGHDMPRVSAGRLGGTANHTTTPAGAGHQVGNFPDVHTATKAGAADAARIRKAEAGNDPVPAEVWKRLAANADDPDYAHGLYDRLGPAGTAGLISAARGDKDHLDAVRTSLGVASHHMTMNEKWLREMLDAALHDGARDDAVALLAHAGLGHRAKVALGHLGLVEMTGGTTSAAHTPQPDDIRPPHRLPPRYPGPPETIQPEPQHLFPAPRPPHEAMITPAADDPHAAVALYFRHPEAIHQALLGAPHSQTLERLVGHATTAHDTDPAAVRANAERLTGFLGSRATGAPG